MGGLNNNAIGLKSNHTMVLSVDFVCGVCSTNQVHDEKDASRFDWGAHIVQIYRLPLCLPRPSLRPAGSFR